MDWITICHFFQTLLTNKISEITESIWNLLDAAVVISILTCTLINTWVHPAWQNRCKESDTNKHRYKSTRAAGWKLTNMNIYFWKEVTNRFQRVSTQIIRYVNLIFTFFFGYSRCCKVCFLFFFFKSSILFSYWQTEDWWTKGCCAMTERASNQDSSTLSVTLLFF